jgi:serine/threonine protein phosphatase PrpC
MTEVACRTDTGRKTNIRTRHQENQDRVLCRPLELGGSHGAVLAVADGITSTPYGGSVARWIIERHLARDELPLSGGMEGRLPETMSSYLRDLYRLFQDELSDIDGFLDSGASLSVSVIWNGRAECFWAGDSPIFLSRRREKGTYESEQISRPDRDPFGRLVNCFGARTPFDLRHQSQSLGSGDIVTVVSDGVAIDPIRLDQIYEGDTPLRAAVEQMITESKRGAFWDDLSVSVGRWKE